MKKYLFILLSAIAIVACSDVNDSPFDISDLSTNVDYSKTGGSAIITLNDGTLVTTVTAPEFSSQDFWSGVEIADDELFFYYHSPLGAEDYVYCQVRIPGYSKGKTSSTYVNMNITKTSEHYYGASVYYKDKETFSSNLTATVKRQDNGYCDVVVKGDLFLSGNGIAQTETPNATIRLEFTAPLLAISKLHRDVNSQQKYFPDGTPWLDGRTVNGALEMKSPVVGNGVLLWYYGKRQADGTYDLGYADYESLKAQAVKLMGEPFHCWDASMAGEDRQPKDGEWSDIAFACFYKDKKYVEVSYCPWPGVYAHDELQMPQGIAAIQECGSAHVQVHVLEDVNTDYTQFLGLGTLFGES